MPNSSPSSLESVIRLFFGFLLWGVSATLTFILLVSLGDDATFSKVLLGIVAIALEGSKILAWRKGGSSRIYAFALITLSGIASLGSSLQVVEMSKGSFAAITRVDIRSSPAYLAQQEELRSIDGEIAALIVRLQALPPDYTTAMARTESSLSALRDRKQAILASLDPSDPVGASHADGTMIVLLARTMGFRPDILLLVLLLSVSTSIEIGALLLTIPDGETSGIARKAEEPPVAPSLNVDTSSSASACLRPSYASPITPEAFLEAAKNGADQPYLHGRDKTAEKLGISSAEAKRLVGRLMREGKISVEGKRLKLL